MFSIGRPIVKSRQFCPNPVAKYGIPVYADSVVNPKVIGTNAWQQWWEEQLHYCINGYDAGGLWISGRYYYYLNFFNTSSIVGFGAEHPDYMDYQYEYFMLVEEAKKLGKNIVVPKGRRKGLSVMTACILDHGFRLLLTYKAGIAAGIKDYSDDFIDKWKFNNMHVAPELRTRLLSKNYDDIIAGWDEKNELTGEWEQKGTMNMIYSRTMHTDPQVFKGKFLNDVIFEESGEFDNLLETYRATKACLMWGDRQEGTMYIYGTGGNIKTGSKGFEQIWHHPDDYNALKYYVSGSKFYPPFLAGSKNKEGKVIEDIPNLLHYEPYQRVGMEDEVRANEVIKENKAALLKAGNLKDYWEYCKDYPGDIKEVFRVAASNYFPQEQLNNQAYKLESEELKYIPYRLEWIKTEKGEIVVPHQVRAIPMMPDEPEDEAVYILLNGHPQGRIRNLYVAGVDSYDQDKSDTSSSLGAMVVLSGDYDFKDVPKNTPVALIRTRPKRKEKFYEMCAMLSVYYNLMENTLIDFGKPAIIQWYKDHGLQRYLAKRPQKFESENSDQNHDYGVSINTYSKPKMVGLLQTYYLDYGDTIWFRVMIDEALRYDELEKESDNDTVDALGIALMQRISIGAASYFNEAQIEEQNPFAYPSYEEDSFGNITMGGNMNQQNPFNYQNKQLEADPFILNLHNEEINGIEDFDNFD